MNSIGGELAPRYQAVDGFKERVDRGKHVRLESGLVFRPGRSPSEAASERIEPASVLSLTQDSEAL
jgi:hypothetical protein